MANKSAVALVAGVCLFTLSCRHTGQTNPEGRPAVRAHTEVVQFSKVSDQFQAPGTIRAKTSTVLSSKIVGQILSLNVHEGDRVHQGQVVAEIESRDTSAQLRRAQAAVTEAQAGLEEVARSIQAAEAALRAAEASRDLALATRKRYDVLRERRSVSPQEYDEVEAKYKAAAIEAERSQETVAVASSRRLQIAAHIKQAEAEADAAQAALEYSRIVSPIDGIVTARHAEPGVLATPGIPLLTIEDDRTYELEVAIEESRAANIAVGQSARIEIDAIQGGTKDGRIREIVPASDPATRTYIVKLQFTKPLPGGHGIRSGFFGRAFFPAGDREALVIPESALIRRGQLEGVYIVEDDVALLRLIKAGKRYGQTVEVLSGLTPGTRIVTAPTREVSDGVKILQEEPSGITP